MPMICQCSLVAAATRRSRVVRSGVGVSGIASFIVGVVVREVHSGTVVEWIRWCGLGPQIVGREMDRVIKRGVDL